jgi:hypothetical protein
MMDSTRVGRYLANAANVVIIVAGIVLIVGLTRISRTTTHIEPGSGYKAGEQLTGLPSGSLSGARKNLVLVMNTSCRFCEESMPFYKRLGQLGNPDVAFAVLGPEPASTLRAYLAGQGVKPNFVATLPDGALGRIRGTPTLVLLDEKGVILDIWVGRLPDAVQNRVLEALAAAAG